VTFNPGSQLDYPKGAKVTTIKDILDAPVFDIADNESANLHQHGEYFRNSKGWGDHLVKTSTPVMITNVMNKDINQHIQEKVHQLIGDYNIRSVYQYWPAGSYIPWHGDGSHKAALTIYLSQHDKDDGGYFMYDDGKGIKAIRPVPNRAVFVTGGIYHTVTTVNQGSALRRTIQVWLRDPS
tara:strand:- start:3920 stop:4462 length:543 start_codon:yes stop_codon:yes gene_type:complete